MGGFWGVFAGVFWGYLWVDFQGYLWDVFDALLSGMVDDPTPRETEDFALRAILRHRLWWGYDCIAASRLGWHSWGPGVAS